MTYEHLMQPMVAMATTVSLVLSASVAFAPVPPSVAYADEVTDAKAQWESLQAEAETFHDALTDTNDRISSLEDEIGQNEGRMAELSAQLDEAKSDLGDFLAKDYKSPSRPSVDEILATSDVGTLIDRMEYSSRFVFAERELVESVSSLMEEMTEIQARLDAERSSLEEQRTQMEKNLADAEAKAEEARSYYASLSMETRRDIATTDMESRMEARASADATDRPVATSATEELVERAYSIIGSGYSWSGYDWTGDVSSSVFTCSGVVDYALGRGSQSSSPSSLYAEVSSNMVYDTSQLRYGDIVFWAFGGVYPTGHTGIYIGDGLVIDSIPNGGVQIRDVNYMEFVGGGPIL